MDGVRSERVSLRARHRGGNTHEICAGNRHLLVTGRRHPGLGCPTVGRGRRAKIAVARLDQKIINLDKETKRLSARDRAERDKAIADLKKPSDEGSVRKYWFGLARCGLDRRGHNPIDPRLLIAAALCELSLRYPAKPPITHPIARTMP